jgi:hypothetical protein
MFLPLPPLEEFGTELLMVLSATITTSFIVFSVTLPVQIFSIKSIPTGTISAWYSELNHLTIDIPILSRCFFRFFYGTITTDLIPQNNCGWSLE